jgi:hypothetical protein
MKNIYYLLFITFLFSCSSGSEDEVLVEEDKIPKEIKLTLEQVWWEKTLWNEETSSRDRCKTNNKYYMYASGWSGNAPHHYGLDTLHIDLLYKGGKSVQGVYFNLRNPSTTEAKTHPKYVKYIKVNNYEGKSLILNKSRLEQSWDKKIIYWESNISDEVLKSLLVDTKSNGCPTDEDAKNTFQKSTASLSSVKNTTKNIPYNSTNDELKVGDKYQNYTVLAKQYIF